MRLQNLKYDFFSLDEEQQLILFTEFYDKREKALQIPIKPLKQPKGPSQKRGKLVTISAEQLEVLKKLKLI